jgi:flagellar hook-length control protein FliK
MDIVSFMIPASQNSASVSFGNSISAGQTDSDSFESVFSKYLSSGEKSVNTSARSAKSTDKESTSESSAERAEKFIDELDIPEEQKQELKKELESVSTEEEAAEFLENMEEVLMMNGLPVMETMQEFAYNFASEGESVSSAANSAMLKTLQAKGYLDSIKTTLGADELSAIEEALQKAIENADADVGDESDAAMLDSGEDAKAPEQTVTETAEAPETEFRTIEITSDTEIGGVSERTVEVKTASGEVQEIKVTSSRDILKIADFIRYTSTQDVKKLTIQLIPKELGKLNIELSEHAGKLTAKITCESDQARTLLANNADSIRQQLQEKGIVLEKMEFLFAEQDSREGADQQQNTAKKSSGGIVEELFPDSADEEEEGVSAGGLYA